VSIHLLEVQSHQEVREVEKQARKLAMTGGYEVSLSSDMSSADIDIILEVWSKQLDKYTIGTKAREVGLAGRILGLLREHPHVSESQKSQISAILGK